VILVDTNVLFDIVTDNREWFAWSKGQLEAADLQGPIAINGIIFAEFSVRFTSLAETERSVDEFGLQILETPRAALFLAGKAYQAYRNKKDSAKSGVLPDFVIGAHAAVLKIPVLTRDPGRFRTYFSSLELITP
jgi:predicted nucleic acid-binding protein